MKIYSLILLLLWSSLIWSQDYKFGKVSKAELEETFYPLDSSANAVILNTKRSTNFNYDSNDGFNIVTDYTTRIKIYNREGFEKATKEIWLYHDSTGKEEVTSLKAITYNLENGKIIKTKLEKKSIFKEEKSKYYKIYKFTMPNIKDGCVIEWKYTLKSPFLAMLDEVELQADIPIKNLEAKITIPEYFVYNPNQKGHLAIPIKKERGKNSITISQTTKAHNTLGAMNNTTKNQLTFEEYTTIINMKSIPALKDEAFSGNINNYKSGIKYELSYINYPGSLRKDYASNWKSIVKKIYTNSSFGDQLKKSNHFKEELQTILQSTKSIDERITTIFQFVKSKIKWNNYNSYYSDEGVKKAYKDGVGNVADINLNLVAMLRFSGLDADPVLVSTINNGIPVFPTRNGFNYVIARVATPNGFILLDATEKNALPNILPDRVLNFQGRVVKDNGDSDWIELFPKDHSVNKSVINSKFTEEGLTGTARKTITNNYLFDYRNSNQNKNKEALLDWINEETESVDVINARVNNLDNLGKDIIETIQFETESFFEEIADKTYISPLLYTQLKENPFKSENREFPIFFNKPWATISTITISIPENYSIENVPENTEYILPDNLGGFRYTFDVNMQTIQIKSNLVINQPVISTNYYQDLKAFYNNIITKQKEKIVLIKK